MGKRPDEVPTAVLQVGTAETVAAEPAAAKVSAEQAAADATLTAVGVPAATAARSAPRELPEIDPAHYELGPELAHGGMGRIRTAHDLRLGREVAIKELLEPRGSLALRFEREALVTARLQHPSIVAVYEAGRWPSGEPFYAMKLVKGRSLKHAIAAAGKDAGARAFDARLALLPHVGAIADAIAYAHGERVVHRDLKPANVLVGDFGETVVIDWGLAKDLAAEEDGAPVAGWRSSDASLTRAGSVMGTPSYMPPEQARGAAVDERADVYAIGAILYHVLAGDPPFSGEDSTKVLEAVANSSPAPLRERERRVAPDLLAIVERAMARDPAARYPTARELAEDLRRFQTGQLVASHQYTRLQLIRRFVRRHRVPVAITAAATVLFAVSGTIAIRAIVRERDTARAEGVRADMQRAVADEQRAKAVASRDALAIARAQDLVDRDAREALRVLATLSPGSPSWSAARTIATIVRDHGVTHEIAVPDGELSAAAASGDGARIVTASRTGVIRLWETGTWQSRELGRLTGDVASVAISHDGQHVAAAVRQGQVRVWDLAAGHYVTLDDHAVVVQVALSADGALLACSSEDQRVAIWDMASRAIVKQLEREALPDLRFAPVGTALASTYASIRNDAGGVRLVDVRRGSDRTLLHAMAIAFSPDATHVATLGADGTLAISELAGGARRVLAHLPVRSEVPAIEQLAWSPDGSTIATGIGGTIELWPALANAKPRILGHDTAADGAMVTFSPDGSTLVARGDALTRWNLQSGESSATTRERDLGLAFPGSGPQLVVLQPSGLVEHELATPSRTALRGTAPAHQVAYLPDGRLLAAAADGTIHIGDETIALGHPLLGQIAISPDATQLAAIGTDGEVRVATLRAGAVRVLAPALVGTSRVLPSDPQYLSLPMPHQKSSTTFVLRRSTRAQREQLGWVAYLRFSPDGRRLAAFAARGNEVHLWDLATGAHRTLTTTAMPYDELPAGSWRGDEVDLEGLRFTPDGRELVAADSAGALHVLDLATGSARDLDAHKSAIEAIEISGDGRIVYSSSIDHAVDATELSTGRTTLEVAHQAEATLLAMSARGDLASGSEDGHVDVRGALAQSFVMPTAPFALAFSGDATRLAAGDSGGDLVIRDLATQISRELHAPGTIVGSLAWSPAGDELAAACDDGTVRVWRDDLPRDEAGLRAWIAKTLAR